MIPSPIHKALLIFQNCSARETEGLRIDLMTRMRGCDDFAALWERRAKVHLPEVGEVGALSLPDLVKAKKTQREKDWPMVRRLIEVDILRAQDQATQRQLRFWFEECRTPSELMRLAKAWPDLCRSVSARRGLLTHALSGDGAVLENGLREEEASQMEMDRRYWSPLRSELEKWRHARG